MIRPPRLTEGTAEDIDKLARRQVRVTKEHNDECKKLLSLMGIPVVTVGQASARTHNKLMSGAWRSRSAMCRAGSGRQGLRCRLRGHGHPHIQRSDSATTFDFLRSEEDAHFGNSSRYRVGRSGHDYGSGQLTWSRCYSQQLTAVHRTVYSPRVRLSRTM